MTRKSIICKQLDGFRCVILAEVATEDWITQEEAAQKFIVQFALMFD